MNWWLLALRNVIRNWQRSLVTTTAMAFACAMMIIFSTLMQGVIAGSERNVVSLNTGDIQLHQSDYRINPDIYKVINSSAEIAQKLRQSGLFVSERVFASGLMASDESSSGVQLYGLDLDNESTVTSLHNHVWRGEWLDKAEPHSVVIGRKLARLLDVTLGDELIFVGQTAEGYMANDRFFVRGILKSVSAGIDNAGVLMSDTMWRELIGIKDGSHEIIVMRPNRNVSLSDTKQAINQFVTNDIEVMTWPQLMPLINQFLETANVQTWIMLLFTYIAVASVILNAMLMSVFERIHQFGIMKALGVRPMQIIALVYIETLWQVVTASGLGITLGYVVSVYLQRHGIDMSAMSDGFSFAGIALDPVWHALISVESFFYPVIFLFLMAALAVIYPAVKVSVINPVDAVHHH